MRKFYYLLAVLAVATTSCQQEVTYTRTQPETQNSEIADPQTRSYEEALAIAEEALKLVDGEDTRSSNHRVIKRNEGQTVMRPVTRGGETTEEPIMYIFNNENDEGFTVVAANRGVEPLIAVTERGNYTYGEPTGVEPFDKYMDDVVETYSTIVHPPIILPDDPIVPTPKPSIYVEHIDIHEVVEPLLSTKWGQRGIYGEFFSNHLSGCTITAVGQVMAYHHHPHYITITYDGSNQRIHLDWTEILKHKTGTEQNDTTCMNNTHTIIGKFLKELAHRSGAKSTSKGTSAFLSDTQPVLDVWGYNRGTVQNINGTSSIFHTIKNNLNDDKPVCISGYHNSNITNGHTWVIDGYHYSSEGYVEYTLNPDYNMNDPFSGPEYIVTSNNVETIRLLHYNWGWDGICDGWFTLNCFDMDNAVEFDRETGNSSSSNWMYGLNVLYDIYPL